MCTIHVQYIRNALNDCMAIQNNNWTWNVAAQHNLQAYHSCRVLVSSEYALKSSRETPHIITSTPAKFQLDPLTSTRYKLCICMYDMASPYVCQPLSETWKNGSQVAGLCSCALHILGHHPANSETALFWPHTYPRPICGAKVPPLQHSCPFPCAFPAAST